MRGLNRSAGKGGIRVLHFGFTEADGGEMAICCSEIVSASRIENMMAP